LQSLKAALPGVIVIGIPTVNRAVIQEEKGNYKILIEGRGLLKVRRFLT
jgi:DNA-directed RNA polymerase III subunit RPC1